jgi:hypothetical protein
MVGSMKYTLDKQQNVSELGIGDGAVAVADSELSGHCTSFVDSHIGGFIAKMKLRRKGSCHSVLVYNQPKSRLCFSVPTSNFVVMDSQLGPDEWRLAVLMRLLFPRSVPILVEHVFKRSACFTADLNRLYF